MANSLIQHAGGDDDECRVFYLGAGRDANGRASAGEVHARGRALEGRGRV